MSVLPDAVYLAADKLGVVVERADKRAVAGWNDARGERELRKFCGWYWHLTNRNGNAVGDRHGPFTSPSAAYGDAITVLERQARDDARVARVLRENALLPPERRPLARQAGEARAHA